MNSFGFFVYDVQHSISIVPNPRCITCSAIVKIGSLCLARSIALFYKYLIDCCDGE